MRHLVRAVSVLVTLGVCVSCGGDVVESTEAPEDARTTAETKPQYVPPPPECQRLGYPCTYDEVDREVLQAAMALAVSANERLVESTTTETATWLSTQEDVVDVMHDDTAIRFRTEGGRPLWLTKNVPGGAPTRGSPSAPGHSHALPTPSTARLADTNGKRAEKRDGVRPYKSALLLSPFLWEFVVDETNKIYEWLTDDQTSKAARHYDIVELVQATTAPVSYSAAGSLGAFYGWDQYDFIHVSSHGAQVCTQGSSGGPCATIIFTGGLAAPVVPGPVPSVVGEEWGLYVPPACDNIDPSDPRYAARACGVNRWWQGVTPDFFRAQGPPLENTVIFMSACESMVDTDLAAALAGPGSTFYGFTIAVPQARAPEIAEAFHFIYLKRGLRADAALTEAKRVHPGLTFFSGGPGTPTRSRLAAPYQQGEMVRAGSPDLRGREVVALLDQTTEIELEDDGLVSDVIGVPNDGRPDSVLVIAQVDGIDDTQSHTNFPVEIQVDGGPKVQVQLQTNPYPEVWQVEATVPLGFDHDPQDVFNIEIRADLEEGGKSRWRYERVRLGGCYWTLDLSGVAGAGRYTGVQATFLDMGQGQTLTLGGVDDERTITTVLLENPPGPGTGPTPFPLGTDPSQEGGLVVQLPVLGNSPQLPLTSGSERPVRDNQGNVVDYEPPPLDFTYTRLDQEWVEGHAYGVVGGPVLPQGYRKGSVQLHFRAKRALDLQAFMGSLGSGGLPSTMPDPDPCNKHS